MVSGTAVRGLLRAGRSERQPRHGAGPAAAGRVARVGPDPGELGPRAAGGQGAGAEPGPDHRLGFGSAGKPPEFIRTHFSLRGWGTSRAAAQRAADPAIRRLRAALRAAVVAEEEIRADPVRMLDTYSRSRKAAGWTAYCGFEVRLRDMTRAERILEGVAAKVGNPTRMFGYDLGIASHEGLVAEAESAATADAQSTATQYARIAGRTLGKVVEARRAYGYGVVNPDTAPTTAMRYEVSYRLR